MAPSEAGSLMEQLPLEVRLDDHAVLETFCIGSNGSLVHALRDAATLSTRGVIWLWGAGETGKTHLLQATVHAGDDGRVRFIR